jgi:hypothetical protein
MNGNRSFWFILTGLILGAALGVLVAWGVPQAQPVNTSPASLRADFKDEYRFMIASAYTLTGDLGRAQARLVTLADADPVKALGEQAQRLLAQNSSMERVRILANLSEALQAQPAGTVSPLSATAPASTASTPEPPPASPTPIPLETATVAAISIPTQADTATPIPTPIFTATLRPTHTPTATQGAAFTLTDQATFCDPQHKGSLQINLENASGQPAAGVELVITWFGGQERFFTGFKNEISPGYADYTLTSGVEYALSLSGGSTRITGLIAPACTDNGKPYPGTIRLEFKQP